MATRKNDPITIAAVEVSNFRRLTFAQVEHVPGKGLVRVTGKNGSGKTSFLRSIMAGLGGAAEVHESSLQEGAEKGQVRIRLTNGFHVERRVTEAAPKGYLDVVSEDGGRYGQGKLDEWTGPHAFDPQAFFALSADRQRDLLFRLGTDPDLPEKLGEVRAEHRDVYEERTPVISEKRHLAKVAKPDGEKPEPVDTSAELAKLRALQAAERERNDLVREHEDARRGAVRDARQQVADAKNAATSKDDELSRAESEHKTAVERVHELQRLLDEAEERAADLSEKVNLLEVERDDAWAAFNDAPDPEAAAASIPEPDLPPDPSEDIAAVQGRLEEADARTKALEPWRRWEEAQARIEELKQAEENLTAHLGALKAREGQLLEQAGIPVEGLAFDDEGSPLLNGRPLAVASGAERVRMAVQVAMAANPDLRVVLLDEEANSLDEDGLQALDELAVEHGFQIWAARVVDDPASEVVVEDGVATNKRAPSAQGAGA